MTQSFATATSPVDASLAPAAGQRPHPPFASGLPPVVDAAVRGAYHAQQASIRYPLMLAHLMLRRVTRMDRSPDPEMVSAMRRRYRDLLERDVENVEAGIYPAELLFQMPLGRYLSELPRFAFDIPRAYLRSKRKAYRDLPAGEQQDRYPPYYRRTFHWQTDGYLSQHSARIYDLSVEFLFMGCADVMRRQVIPPMARFLGRARRTRTPAKILDVGCGTGRTLHQIARALPANQYFGVDLSPYYAEEARKLLRTTPEASVIAENAETLPFVDGHFDVVTSTYLFHELPRNARRNALAEMIRVLKPGGLLVLEDSAQYSDASEIAFFLDNFSSEMHEPFYPDYLRDDLSSLLDGHALSGVTVDPCWVAKVVVGRKPA